jgi:para-nitrobenzyl esterase
VFPLNLEGQRLPGRSFYFRFRIPIRIRIEGDDMAAPSPLARIEVSAPAGRVTGMGDGGVGIFRGIRFAQPPVGDLRFAAPVDAAPVQQIDATDFGPVSLQDIDPLPRAIPGTENNFYAPGAVTSEDCLNLNIWTGDTDGSAPVLFWIHGGAFMYGSGTGPWTDGSRYAREHGVVVVTVNYRLGLLGNLWLGDLDPTASDLALQDQVSALRWVQRNIAAFGGDPNRVTIAGQSAGAMSVAALMTAPAARGLYARAIVESGHVAVGRTVTEALATREVLFHALAVDPEGDVLAQLRAMSTLRLLQVQREFGIGIRAFPIVTDGVVLPTDLLEAIRGGSAQGVDLIIGTTAEEDRLFSVTGWANEHATVVTVLAGLLTDPADAAAAEELYGEVPGSDRDRQFIINTDHGWASPARMLADAHAAAGNRVFHYDFARRSGALDGRVGAAHLAELPFFWGNLDAPGVTSLLGDDVLTDPGLIDLGDRLSGTIAQFVATGSADGGPLGSWPVFTADARDTLVIDVEPAVVRDHKVVRLDFWASHDSAPALANVAEEG